MKSLHKSFGSQGENLAEEYLKSLNYVILERNFRCKLGEIDIVCTKNNLIIFVEVKTRLNKNLGLPCESVNFSKQKKIFRVAEYYILKNNIKNVNYRFDVIEISYYNSTEKPDVNLITDAFRLY